MEPSFFERHLRAPLTGFVERRPFVALVLLLIYAVVPIDLVPEMFTGFLGYADDIVLFVFYGLIKRRLKRRNAAASTETTAQLERQ